MKAKSIYGLRQQALKFLSRREYSRYELQRKLTAKGWSVAEVGIVLDELAAERLQDDSRFVGAYSRYRSEAGYGPRRILAELAERGIKEVPAELADENSACWLEALQRVWQKKFNGQAPRDLATKAKQARFLIYRGFTPEQVYQFFRIPPFEKGG